jgi:hypothetical protein
VNLGKQAINTSRDYGLDLTGHGGASLLGLFTGSEMFSATLWAGDDRTAAATLTAVWDEDLANNPEGVAKPRVKLTVLTDAIDELVPGRYFVQVVINPGTDDVPVLEDGSFLELTPAPGSGTAADTYCSLDDVRRYAPWIDKAAACHGSIQLDLAELRARARSIVDDRITLAYVAGTRGGIITRAVAETYLTIDSASTEIRAWLDGDKLMVSGSRGEVVKEITARLTIAMTCEPLLGGPDDKATYQKLGAFHRRMAESLLSGYRAELDTDGDGEVDLVIPLGVRSSR